MSAVRELFGEVDPIMQSIGFGLIHVYKCIVVLHWTILDGRPVTVRHVDTPMNRLWQKLN